MSSSDLPFHVRTPQIPAGIELLDTHRRIVISGIGEIRQRVSKGIYRLRVTTGTDTSEQLIAVEGRGYKNLDLKTSVVSAAPVIETHASHETHANAAQMLAERTTGRGFGNGTRLVVFARNIAPKGMKGFAHHIRAPIPFNELSLFRLDVHRVRTKQLFEAPDRARGNPQQGWVGFSVNLQPGSYILRWARPRKRRSGVWRNPFKVIDQALYLTKNWTTLVFIGNRSETGLMRANASIHMTKLHEPWQAWGQFTEEKNLASELVLSGLRRGTSLIGKKTVDILLREKFENPMLGVLGTHALLRENQIDTRSLNKVMSNLQELIGSEHPDWQALCSLAYHRGHRRWKPEQVVAPPMLHASYRALIVNDPRHSDLLPAGSAAERLAPLLRSETPWTTWVPPEERKRSRFLRDERRDIEVAGWLGFRVDGPLATRLNALAGAIAPESDMESAEVRKVADWIRYAHDAGVKGNLSSSDLAEICGLPIATTRRALARLRDVAEALAPKFEDRLYKQLEPFGKLSRKKSHPKERVAKKRPSTKKASSKKKTSMKTSAKGSTQKKNPRELN